MTFTFREAIEYSQGRKVLLPSQYYGEMQGRSRAMAFSIAGIASRDQLQGVLDSLTNILKSGGTFDTWKKDAAVAELGLPNHRLDNIFRTNMQSAYNQGHWTKQQASKDRRPYLMYDAVNDNRTRPSHSQLDNVIRHIDDPFWETHYPPNGFRCRCTTLNLTEKQAIARGGVTPDPPEGWIAPDKGWDYNPGANMPEGLAKSTEALPRGDSRLQKAMEDTLTSQTQSPVSQVINAHNINPDTFLEGMRTGKAGVIDRLRSIATREEALNILESAVYLSDLTENQQAYLRLISIESVYTKGVALETPANLYLTGNIAQVADQLGMDVIKTLSPKPARSPELFRTMPNQLAYYEVGDRFKVDGFVLAYAKPSSTQAKSFAIAPSSGNAIPTTFISANPVALEWMILPGTRLQVSRVTDKIIYLEAIK